MLNNVILIGRLTKDVDLRYTPNGTAVASFTLAVSRDRKVEGQQDADFIGIVVWQKQAENCAEYIGKGSLVAVEGRLQVRSYDDKEGKKQYITELVAEKVKFLENKKKEEQQSSYGTEVQFDEDDVPF
jgi:single-strand DNA-binding protein